MDPATQVRILAPQPARTRIRQGFQRHPSPGEGAVNRPVGNKLATLHSGAGRVGRRWPAGLSPGPPSGPPGPRGSKPAGRWRGRRAPGPLRWSARPSHRSTGWWPPGGVGRGTSAGAWPGLPPCGRRCWWSKTRRSRPSFTLGPGLRRAGWRTPGRLRSVREGAWLRGCIRSTSRSGRRKNTGWTSGREKRRHDL